MQTRLVGHLGMSFVGGGMHEIVIWQSGSRPSVTWGALVVALGMILFFAGTKADEGEERDAP